ncbi:MAG: hypothetical protein ABF242_05895 [Flavobacteriales bacterium]
MNFYISSFQMEPDYIFNHSYKVDQYISKKISQELAQIEIGFDVIFSISCYGDNPNDLILIDQTRGRKKPKMITQYLSFPHNNLLYRSDWVLNLSSFDFIEKENAYRTYPLKNYISLILESLNIFFVEENQIVDLDYKKIENELINHFEKNKGEFTYLNQELMTLQDLIDETHPCFVEDYGDWLESDIGKNWVKLRDKYEIDRNGNLKLK